MKKPDTLREEIFDILWKFDRWVNGAETDCLNMLDARDKLLALFEREIPPCKHNYVFNTVWGCSICGKLADENSRNLMDDRIEKYQRATKGIGVWSPISDPTEKPRKDIIK